MNVPDILSLSWRGPGTMYQINWLAQSSGISPEEAEKAIRIGKEQGLLVVETSIVERDGSIGPTITDDNCLDERTYIHPDTGEGWDASDVMVSVVSTPTLDRYAVRRQKPPDTWVAQWQTAWQGIGLLVQLRQAFWVIEQEEHTSTCPEANDPDMEALGSCDCGHLTRCHDAMRILYGSYDRG